MDTTPGLISRTCSNDFRRNSIAASKSCLRTAGSRKTEVDYRHRGDVKLPSLAAYGVGEHGLVDIGHSVARDGAEFWLKQPRAHAAAGHRFMYRAGGGGNDKLRHVGGISPGNQGTISVS